MTPLIPLPRCPCGTLCSRRWQRKGIPRKYCSPVCVPRQIRVDAGRRGRKQFILDARLRRFRGHLARLRALDRITAQELIAVFADIEARSYDNGYACCEHKWLAKTGRKRKAVAA